MSNPAQSSALEGVRPTTLRARLLASRLGRGDLGFIPVIVALVVIAIVFQLANGTFLTPRNISNLTLQLGTLGVLTLGMVLVLLMGEIDLSAGSVAGFAAAVMAILSAQSGQSPFVSILVALGVGALIGAMQGLWIVVVRAPSFIVTLTGLLVWQGAQHMSLGYQIGQLEVDDSFITGIASTFMPGWLTLLLVAAVVAGAVLYALTTVPHTPRETWMRRYIQVAIYPIVTAVIAAVLWRYSGVPYLLLLLLVLTGVLTIVTEATPFGVHIFAVGGNSEAARRAGINVPLLRVVIFSVCSALAALAGIISASRQYAVDSNTGGGNLVLDSIAAAVIGGTSLFGGRGRVIGGLLGAVVIASVANGLDLLGQSADVKTIITGLILLAAVSVDMLARRRRISSGAAGA